MTSAIFFWDNVGFSWITFKIRVPTELSPSWLACLIFTKYLKADISYQGVTRVETYPFPKDAIREAVFNAIAHNATNQALKHNHNVLSFNCVFWHRKQEISITWKKKIFQGIYRFTSDDASIMLFFSIFLFSRTIATLCFPYELHIVAKSVSHVLETLVSSLSTPHGTAFEILSLFFQIISLILLPVPGTPASCDISGLNWKEKIFQGICWFT